MSLDSLTTTLRDAGLPVCGLALLEPNTEYRGGYVEMTSMGQVRIDWERTPTVIELQSVSNICRADAQQERFSVYATLKLMSPEDQLDIVLRTAAITIESKPEAFRDLYLSALPPVPAF